jgi:hypothetical protein
MKLRLNLSRRSAPLDARTKINITANEVQPSFTFLQDEEVRFGVR